MGTQAGSAWRAVVIPAAHVMSPCASWSSCPPLCGEPLSLSHRPSPRQEAKTHKKQTLIHTFTQTHSTHAHTFTYTHSQIKLTHIHKHAPDLRSKTISNISITFTYIGSKYSDTFYLKIQVVKCKMYLEINLESI